MSSLDSSDIAVAWALTATATVLTVGRCLIRWSVIRQSLTRWTVCDDLFHLLSLVALIVFDATNETHNAAKLDLDAAIANPQTSQPDILSGYVHLLVLSRVNNCFLYLLFWLVKISFLMFYRSLFDISRPFRRAWWVVLVYTVLTFWVPIGGVLATCAGASTVPEFEQCNIEGSARQVKLEYTCVMVVTSDVAIMALPLWMLKGLKMRPSQRFGLAFIFCFAFVVIALDILRTVEAIGLKQALFTILETNFAVIICCLPAYRALLTYKPIKLGSSKKSSRYGDWSRSSNPGNTVGSKATDDRQPLKRNLGNGSTVTSDLMHDSRDPARSLGEPDPSCLEAQSQDTMELDTIGGKVGNPTSLQNHL